MLQIDPSSPALPRIVMLQFPSSPSPLTLEGGVGGNSAMSRTIATKYHALDLAYREPKYNAKHTTIL
jgi:hypothetical protein